jgi:hypothetical protein
LPYAQNSGTAKSGRAAGQRSCIIQRTVDFLNQTPRALSISRKNVIVPAGNDAIYPSEAMTEMGRIEADWKRKFSRLLRSVKEQSSHL